MFHRDSLPHVFKTHLIRKVSQSTTMTRNRLFDQESQDDSDSLTVVPPPPSRSERHVVIEGDEEFEEWPQLPSPNDDDDNFERPLIDTEDDDPNDLGLLDPTRESEHQVSEEEIEEPVSEQTEDDEPRHSVAREHRQNDCSGEG